jgi:Ca2+-binding RTX toxin-like protein
MSFANIEPAILFSGFSVSEKTSILAAMRTAYDGSAIARDMFDHWVGVRGLPIDVRKSPGVFGAGQGNGKLLIDLAVNFDATYADNFGRAVKDTLVTALVHELVHALKGFDDNVNATDYQGDTVRFSNNIYRELGLPEQNSYLGWDDTGSFLVLGNDYSRGSRIDRSFVSGFQYQNWDSSAAGVSRDLLIGDQLANSLISGEGNDFLYGGEGSDTLDGGGGDDELYANTAGLSGDSGFINILLGGAGNDKLYGAAGADELNGGAGNDSVYGAAGDDTLDGGAGDDIMDGGNGNDTYYVDSRGDRIIDSSGIDSVRSTIDYTLGTGLENLRLLAPTPSGQGQQGNGAINGTGNDLINIISGNSLGNTLKGLGGNDDLYGGLGTDTAVYRGKEKEYTVINIAPNRKVVIDSRAGRDGVDWLFDIENLKFAPDTGSTPPYMPFPNPFDWLFDPLVVDLDGDGVKLIGLAESQVNFDFEGDGFRERTGWVSAGDGLLVRDLDGNGRIEALRELIGTATQDAYSVLRGLDANADGKITSADSVWTTLRIWRDADSDGVTDAGELLTLANLGITEFGLADRAVNRMVDGNLIYSAATASAYGVPQETQAIFFGTARNIAVFTPPAGFVPHADTVKLPKLSGGGGTPSLTYSMTVDTGLRAAVQNLMQASKNLSVETFRARVETILLDWSGADTAVAGSRGPHIDARWVKMLEAFGGSNYRFTEFNAPRAHAAAEIYQQLVDDFTVRFMIQSFSSYVALNGANDPGVATHAYRYLTTVSVEPTYNGVFFDYGPFMMTVLQDLQRAGGDPVAALLSASANVALANALYVMNNLARSDQAGAVSFLADDLPSLLAGLDGQLVAAGAILAAMTTGFSASDIVFGPDDPERPDVTGNSPVVFAGDADNIVTIGGVSRSNILFGGRGDDTLDGNSGSDIYVWTRGDGNDVITDYGWDGSDTLVLYGISAANVSFEYADHDVKLVIAPSAAGAANGGRVTLRDLGYSDRNIEWVELADVRWSAADVRAKALAAAATSGNDTIRGFEADDVLTGGAGVDTLMGGLGRDIYVWNRGDGHDVIDERGNFGSNQLTLSGVTAAQISFRRDGNDLTLVIAASAPGRTDGGSVELLSFAGRFDVVLADVTWASVQLYEIILTAAVTPNNDYIQGFSGADRLRGGAATILC